MEQKFQAPALKWSQVLNQGLVAGGILLFVGAVGMLAAFNDREVVRDFFTLGQLMMAVIPFVAAFLMTRKVMTTHKEPVQALMSGLAIGILTALPSLILLWLTNALPDMGDILVNVNRDWIDTVTFDNRREQVKGASIFFGVIFGAGVAGTILYFIPEKLRKALIYGTSFTLTIGVFGETVNLILDQLLSGDMISSLFRRDTLLLTPAFTLLRLSILFAFLQVMFPEKFRKVVIYGSTIALLAGILGNAFIDSDTQFIGVLIISYLIGFALVVKSPMRIVVYAILIVMIVGIPFYDSNLISLLISRLSEIQVLTILTSVYIAIQLGAIHYIAPIIDEALPSQAEPDVSENSKTTSSGITVETVSMVLGVVLLLALPWIIGRSLSDVAVTVGLFVLMGFGLNIAIGLAGLLDLGYVTNYAVGAYILAVLTSTGLLGRGPEWLNFWMVIPIALLAAMLAGFIFAVPVLKMRGDYLAIATLGFGEIIGKLALSDWLAPIIGGAQGVLRVPKPVIWGPQISAQATEAVIWGFQIPFADRVFEIIPIELKNPEQLYYIILAACVVTLFVSTRLNNSRTGRQWMAIREDEDVASAMGINVAQAKLLAFTLSAATGGVAGAIFAAKVGTVFPNSFTVFISINVLSLIIVGGMGSNPGILLGAIALVGMPELLREFTEYRWLIYGALLIFMMVNRPEGLWPSSIRQREINTDTEPDSQGKPVAVSS